MPWSSFIAALPAPSQSAVAGMDPASLTALIALITAVLAGVGWGVRWLGRGLRRIGHFLDDYNGQPARDGLPARPGFMARLGSVEELLQHVVDETKPNHGSSLRDSLSRVERDVADIKTEQAAVRTRLDIADAGRTDR